MSPENRTEGRASDEMSPPRLLIIEDNAATRRKLAEVLSAPPLSASIREAENGAVGLKLAMTEEFDCIICDLEMPVMHGIAFLRAIRKERSRFEVPLLLLTARDSVQEKVHGFQCGASDYLSKPFEPMELLARVETHVSLARMHRQLQRAADTDWLTGLQNRRAFMRSLTRELSRVTRVKKPVSLLLTDVDHFKSINDTFGHPTGDAVLRGLAQIMMVNQRPYDLVGRLGGEEFAVILPEVEEPDAVRVAERLRARVEASSIGELPKGRVTLSIGVVSDRDGGANALEQLYQLADERLYEAKRGGRNRVCAG